jgi:hypothetical protein
MDVKEGWEPLCKFLGKPIPDEGFPRTNDAEATDAATKALFLKLVSIDLLILSIFAAGLYFGWRLFTIS